MKRYFALLVIAMSFLNASGAGFNRTPAGQIKGARLEFVSPTNAVIRIGPGYGDIKGAYWEISPTDTLATTGYSLSGLTSSANGTWQYLYISKNNSLLPSVTIVNSMTAPAWNAAELGWYNGDDRCIGSVYVESWGVLKEFQCPDDETYVWAFPIQVSPGSAGTGQVWNTYDMNSYGPVNGREEFVQMEMWGSGYTWTRAFATFKTDQLSLPAEGSGVVSAQATQWLFFKRGVSKKIMWLASASVAGPTVQLGFGGYRIER